MRIGDHDLGGAGRLGGLDRGDRFAGHELAEAAVLESRRTELLGGDDAGDPFHVDRDVDLQLGLPGVRRFAESQARSSQDKRGNGGGSEQQHGQIIRRLGYPVGDGGARTCQGVVISPGSHNNRVCTRTAGLTARLICPPG